MKADAEKEEDDEEEDGQDGFKMFDMGDVGGSQRGSIQRSRRGDSLSNRKTHQVDLID